MAARDRIDRGECSADAASAARREFGNVALVQHVTRDQWGWTWLEDFAEDIRFAARTLPKSPGFTAGAVITLALGIGANTPILGLVNAVLLRPLPAKDPDQLVPLSFQQPGGASTALFSYPDYRDIREQASAAFSDMLAYRVGLDALSVNGQAQRIMVHYVTGNYFTLLGVEPALG